MWTDNKHNSYRKTRILERSLCHLCVWVHGKAPATTAMRGPGGEGGQPATHPKQSWMPEATPMSETALSNHGQTVWTPGRAYQPLLLSEATSEWCTAATRRHLAASRLSPRPPAALRAALMEGTLQPHIPALGVLLDIRCSGGSGPMSRCPSHVNLAGRNALSTTHSASGSLADVAAPPAEAATTAGARGSARCCLPAALAQGTSSTPMPTGLSPPA